MSRNPRGGLAIQGSDDARRRWLQQRSARAGGHPEVRTLLRALEASWAHWAYFFNQVDDSINLLLSCVAGSRFLGRGAVEMDADLVAAAMGRAFGGMNMVFDRFDFPEDELEKMSNGLVEVLQQAGMA